MKTHDEDGNRHRIYWEAADHLDTIASIRRGLAQAKEGMGRSVDEVFDDLDHAASAEG